MPSLVVMWSGETLFPTTEVSQGRVNSPANRREGVLRSAAPRIVERPFRTEAGKERSARRRVVFVIVVQLESNIDTNWRMIRDWRVLYDQGDTQSVDIPRRHA